MAAQPSAERSRGSSRGALIEAALAEFSENGYEAATVAGVAERAGVTTGALYAHFDSKLALLIESIGLASIEDFHRMLSSMARLPWVEVAEVLGRSLGDQHDRRTSLLLDVIVVARRDAEVAGTLRFGLESYLDAVISTTEHGVAAGLIDPALEPTDLARLLAAISFGLLVLDALDEPRPTAGAFGHVMDLLLQSPGRVDGDEPAALARVRSRAAATDRARRQLHQAIVEAAAQGQSLRRIGAAAGLSHERVRSIVANDPLLKDGAVDGRKAGPSEAGRAVRDR